MEERTGSERRARLVHPFQQGALAQPGEHTSPPSARLLRGPDDARHQVLDVEGAGAAGVECVEPIRKVLDVLGAHDAQLREHPEDELALVNHSVAARVERAQQHLCHTWSDGA